MEHDEAAAERLRVALELFDDGVEIMRCSLRRQRPSAPPEAIEQALQDWLLHRPGAEAGDGAGRPGVWPR